MGFIHDKLDIKFLILYLMARVAGPVDFTTLADLTFCDDGVEYFDFAESVAELVSTGHLAVEGDLYTITDKGRRNGEICESSLAFPCGKVRPEPGQGQRGAPPQRPSPVGTPSPGGWGGHPPPDPGRRQGEPDDPGPAGGLRGPGQPTGRPVPPASGDSVREHPANPVGGGRPCNTETKPQNSRRNIRRLFFCYSCGAHFMRCFPSW